MELYMWAVDSQDREMENVRRVDRRLGETEEQVGRRAARYATRWAHKNGYTDLEWELNT